jgi:threonine dehydratase
MNCTISVAAENANPMKIEAMRRFGADVKLVGPDFDAAKEAAHTYASEHGLRFVEDGAEAAITRVRELSGWSSWRPSTLVQALRLAHQDLGLMLEPAGAAGIAAIMADPGRFRRPRLAAWYGALCARPSMLATALGGETQD